MLSGSYPYDFIHGGDKYLAITDRATSGGGHYCV
jgi:hypothetical protein